MIKLSYLIYYLIIFIINKLKKKNIVLKYFPFKSNFIFFIFKSFYVFKHSIYRLLIFKITFFNKI